MALTAMSVSDTWVFESDRDPDKGTENATKFTLGTLDVFLKGHIFDSATEISGQGSITIHTNKTNIEAVRFGLKGWSNFRDKAGNDVPFKTLKRNVGGRSYDVVSDETLNRLSLDDIQELGQAIKTGNVVTEEEAKKSDAA